MAERGDRNNQAMELKEQQKAVAALSISDVPTEATIPVGSKSTTGSTTESTQKVNDAVKESQPATKSRRKRGRKRKAAQQLTENITTHLSDCRATDGTVHDASTQLDTRHPGTATQKRVLP